MTKHLLFLPLLLAIALQFSTVAAQRPGLLFTVNSASDSHDAAKGDGVCADAAGVCTLRAAIEEANVTTPRDAIVFDLGPSAAVDLTIGELSVSNPLDIVGPGARRLTIRRSAAAGTANFRIFHYPRVVISTDPASIRGVTIANGNDSIGGGMLVEIGNYLSVYDTRITDNHATSGAGVYSLGATKLLLDRCLVDGNSARSEGGGVYTAGGVSAANTGVMFTTFTGNSAPRGGAISNHGSNSMINATISGNLAGLEGSSIYSGVDAGTGLVNSIVGPDSLATTSLQGVFGSGGHNVITNAKGSVGFTNGVNGDQVSTGNQIDPKLGPLANNGGELDSMALLPGSPAIDAGVYYAGFWGVSRLDERRWVRPEMFTHIDIGAFELDAVDLAGVPLAAPSFHIGGLAARCQGSRVTLIDPVTAERRTTILKLGNYNDAVYGPLPFRPVYIVELSSKACGRNGIFATDGSAAANNPLLWTNDTTTPKGS